MLRTFYPSQRLHLLERNNLLITKNTNKNSTFFPFPFSRSRYPIKWTNGEVALEKYNIIIHVFDNPVLREQAALHRSTQRSGIGRKNPFFIRVC